MEDTGKEGSPWRELHMEDDGSRNPPWSASPAGAWWWPDRRSAAAAALGHGIDGAARDGRLASVVAGAAKGTAKGGGAEGKRYRVPVWDVLPLRSSSAVDLYRTDYNIHGAAEA
jgi:hypothetical protein